jgi:ABC-2 type transport system permease protein
VLRHYLYFVGCSVRNRVRRQQRRLRSPRYAIAALIGVAYFYLIFGRPASGSGDTLGLQYVAAARVIGPLFLSLLAAWWWLWGGHRAGLVLTPAETHLLVPAPLSRRALVRFKILQAQVPILFSAALGALITRGAGLPWPFRFLSLWLLLATLHQHQIAASLVHAAADEQGRRGIRRNIIPIALFLTGFSALAWALARAVAEIRAAATIDFAIERLGTLMVEPVPRIVLGPFRLLLDPLTATAVESWSTAFLVALVVLAGHYFWVQRTDAAFEEVAATEGETRAARAAAVRSGGFGRLTFSRADRPKKLARPLLPLRPLGRPATAVLWKNLLYSQRLIRPRTLVVLAAFTALLLSPVLFGAPSAAQALGRTGFMLIGFSGLVTAFGALAIRNDLRMDLVNIETLRTYPLRGRDVVAAEIAASTLVIVLIQQPLLLGGLLLLTLAGTLTPQLALAAAAAAMLALPAVSALSVVIQNTLALLYPGWVRVGHAGSGGMEAVGQNLLTLIGTLLLLVLTALPPLIAGVIVAAPFVLASQTLAIIAGVVGVVAAVAVEVVLLVLWLGGLYDRTDPVAAGLLQ